MVIPTVQRAYSQAQGTSSIPQFLFLDRDPTANDINYVLYQGWVNTLTYGIWYLESFIPLNGVITAQWRAVAPIVVKSVPPASPLTASSDYSYPIGQTWCDNIANDYYVMISNPTDTTGYWVKLSAGTQGADFLQGNSGGPVGPDADGIINVIGQTGQIDVVGTPLNNTLTISLTGGSEAIDSVQVDAFTAPGTNPVLPTAAGLITVTGSQVVAGTNPVRTNSLAANTYAVQVQRSQAIAAADVTKIGLCNFNSSQFSVDSTGFVSSTGFSSVNVQTFTSSGTYTPTSGMSKCIVQCVGGGGGGGGANTNQNSSGAGGGSGAYCTNVFSAATIGASQTVTIGAGGTAGTTAAAGGTGGTTTFGGLLSAGGGLGAEASNTTLVIFNYTGGSGGTATGGYINVSGNAGDDSAYGVWASLGPNSGALSHAGNGGASFFGGAGESAPSGLISNGGAGSFGGGGGGASTGTSGVTHTGGVGGNGVIIVTEYII